MVVVRWYPGGARARIVPDGCRALLLHGRVGRMGQGGGDWKQRARRAEATAEAARAQAVSKGLQYEARERNFDELITSISWRLTTPLRRANTWRRAARARLRRERS